MLTLAFKTVVTDIVNEIEVAGEPFTQGAFEVIIHEITSPLTNEEEV